MAKEVILVFRDGRFKTVHEDNVKFITDSELKKASYALVSVLGGEVQRYLPIDPDYLIRDLKDGGDFSYKFEYFAPSSYADDTPEFIPMDLHTVHLESIFDLYDAIYFMRQVSFEFDILNPNEFDDMKILDIPEIHFGIPDSSIGKISIHIRKKISRVSNMKGLAVEDINEEIGRLFGIMTELTDGDYSRIQILECHSWILLESPKDEPRSDGFQVVSTPLCTGAIVFINKKTMDALDYMNRTMLTVLLYDATAMDEEFFTENVSHYVNTDFIDDAIVGMVSGALSSGTEVLTFLVEMKFVYETTQFIMSLHDFCNVNGVMFTMKYNIRRPVYLMHTDINDEYIETIRSAEWEYNYGIENPENISPIQIFIDNLREFMDDPNNYQPCESDETPPF